MEAFLAAYAGAVTIAEAKRTARIVLFMAFMVGRGRKYHYCSNCQADGILPIDAHEKYDKYIVRYSPFWTAIRQYALQISRNIMRSSAGTPESVMHLRITLTFDPYNSSQIAARKYGKLSQGTGIPFNSEKPCT